MDDEATIDRILEAFGYDFPTVTRVISLGKTREGSSRPIQILHAKEEGNSLIDVYSDSKQNLFSLMVLESLRTRLFYNDNFYEPIIPLLRNKNGEHSLTIVYTNGIPKFSSFQVKNGYTRVQSTNQSYILWLSI